MVPCALVSDRGRRVELPGVVLRPRRGPGPVASDMPFVAGLSLSSRTRAYLENLRPSRARGGRVPRTLRRIEVEARLDRLVRTAGETGVNRLRDGAREIAVELGLQTEAAQLDSLIGALLGTRRSQLESPVAIARGRGRPYDPDRLELFHKLHQALRGRPPSIRPTPARDARGRATLAFFEAYFSNFVEGTEFLVDEAIRIVFEGEIPPHRPADAHDVAGTWRVLSDAVEMARNPRHLRGVRWPPARTPSADHGRAARGAARRIQGGREPGGTHRLRRSGPRRGHPRCRIRPLPEP